MSKKFTTIETDLLELLNKMQPNCKFNENALCSLANKIEQLCVETYLSYKYNI